jgi:hypothetical protein
LLCIVLGAALVLRGVGLSGGADPPHPAPVTGDN